MKIKILLLIVCAVSFLFFSTPAQAQKYINETNGGHCRDFGIWDDGSKTCTLTADVNDSIKISSSAHRVTLDGNGHSVIGSETPSGTGILGVGSGGAIIKNVKVSGFYYGMGFSNGSNGNKVTDSVMTNNVMGIVLGNNKDNEISNNIIKENEHSAIQLIYSENNLISNNTIGPDNNYGIYLAHGGKYNTYENNNIFGNREYGIKLYDGGGYNNFTGNTVKDNGEYGIYLAYANNYKFSGNSLSGNGKSNFSMDFRMPMDSNDFDETNTIEGKKLYYVKNSVNEVFDFSSNVGAFYCIDCKNVTLKDSVLSERGAEVVFWRTSDSTIENVGSFDKTSKLALYNQSSENIVKNNDFYSVSAGSFSNNNKIHSNNFWSEDVPSSNDLTSKGNIFNLQIPIGGNFWKKNEASCVDADENGFCDAMFMSGGVRDYLPLIKEVKREVISVCQENCFSNVLFLPGIKASKLYKQGSLGTEDQLWPPNYFGNDLKELFLDKDGKSIENVYTRDAIYEVGAPWIGDNIYKTFSEKLAVIKENGTINNYSIFAYDWRQNVEDIAQNGTSYPDGEIKSATASLISLAESSKSKKVTIIAHSNGGLLAKAIVQELEKRGLTEKVDKLVMVGTPQMGTPLAILSMLYGYDESALFGTLISRKDARSLAENMPGAYGLLPSAKYFERMQDPFITFNSLNTRYKDFIDAYGGKINSFSEFEDFLLGKGDDRKKPDDNELEKENILNERLFAQANEIHQRLDNWSVPQDIEVIQIAGWGLDTVSGIEYTEKEIFSCGFKIGTLVCLPSGKYEAIYDPKFTVDGDKVVVAPSALMLPEAPNVKRYWVDLWTYNDNNIPDRQHKNIFEINSIQQFISNIITENYKNVTLPENIFFQRPNPKDYINQSPHLRMSLYSPLDVHLYDSLGNHTGPKIINVDGKDTKILEENIPNSYYYEFGERKYIGFASGENIRVEMEGYATGTYTLKLEELKAIQEGEQLVAQASFANLPTTENSIISFEVPETGLAGMTALEADLDRDGENDYIIEKILGGEATILTTVEQISENIVRYFEENLITDIETRDFLQIKIREIMHIQEMIAKMDDKEKMKPKENQIKLLNKKIDDLILFIDGKLEKKILSPVKETLIRSLEYIKI